MIEQLRLMGHVRQCFVNFSYHRFCIAFSLSHFSDMLSHVGHRYDIAFSCR